MDAEARKRLISSALSDLSKDSDVILLQETNLGEKERMALRGLEGRGFSVSRNNFRQNVAGTAIVDTPSLRKFYEGRDVKLPDEVRGRVQLRRYLPKDLARPPFQVFNLYLVSGPDYGASAVLLRSLLTVDASVPTFVGGDMNFVEVPSDSTSSNPSLPTSEFLVAWDAFKTHFSLEEAPHDAHTHFHVTTDVLSSHSHTARLDRFLLPADAFSHPLFAPSVSIPHHPTNFSVSHRGGPRRSFSDHLPVRLSFSSAPSLSARRPTIPTWLAESPAFAMALRFLWKGRRGGGPFKELARFKKVLFSAAKVARRVKVEASTINLKVSQRIALFKLITPPRQDHARIAYLLELSPSLKELVRFDGSRWVSSGLEGATRDSVTSASLSSQPKAPNILRVLADRLPSSRAQLVSLRLSPDDVPAVTPAGKSALASQYWSGV